MLTNVMEYLERTAAAHPDKTAIEDAEGTYTFRELRDVSLAIAARISERLGGKRRHPLLIYLPKNRLCVAALLGTVYSGNIYTPVDIQFPIPKVQSIQGKLQPALIVTDKRNAAKLRGKSDVRDDELLILDEDPRGGAQFDVRSALSKSVDTDPVYILFTSGSTGVPKGVIITHRNIIDYIEWAVPACGIGGNTRMGNQSPFYFDISTQDIYSCLMAAATLVIIPKQLFSFPVDALTFIRDRRIDYLYWVPTAFINLCSRGALDAVDISCVKRIIFGGEVMPTKYLRIWQERLPGLRVMNVYGPTEATVNITYFPVDRVYREDEALPLGFPCGNTDLLVIGEDGGLITETNRKGELYARGSGLSPGYWNDPEKTREVFIQNPLNPHFFECVYGTGDLVHYNDRGELMFDGRKDHQIKHLGYRIELGEIEAAALSYPGASITACADYDSAESQIVLFFAGEMDNASLQQHLAAMLPKYMVPTRYVALERLPLTDNGKADRKRLHSEHIAARPGKEARVLPP